MNRKDEYARLSSEQIETFRYLLSGRERVLVTTHIAPDGDAIASLLAASHILEMLNSRTACLLDGDIPRHLSFLPGYETIQRINTVDRPSDYRYVFILDSANLERIGDVKSFISSDAELVNVDHHPDNTDFGNLNIVSPDAASTTELLFDICEALHIRITPALATLLYTGILTDTGGFRYANTTDRTFSIAAHLVKSGADPSAVSELVFAGSSPTEMKILGKALNSLDMSADGSIATMVIEQANEVEETEDLSEYPFRIRGVRAVALLRIQNGTVRVSLRGRGAVNVAEIARRFGGGGHEKAAGFTITGDAQSIRRQVVELLRLEIESNTAAPA